jgi:hypothetical protein
MYSWPVAALLVLGLGHHARAADEAAGWITDYDKARAAARTSGKPIFLVFRCER